MLCGRLKTRLAFTTKEVGKGFYRGSGTGSMGAHTAKGEYLIDYRKVRHFVKPDLDMKKVQNVITRPDLWLISDANTHCLVDTLRRRFSLSYGNGQER